MGIPQRPKRDAASTFIQGAVKEDPEEKDSTVITLRISREMVRRIDTRAKELNISRTALMKLATQKMLEDGL